VTAIVDHLVVACEALEAGAAALEQALGVSLAPGGRHDAFGTHNRLLSLGPETYLELIAIDPEAAPPDRPRWFDLDRFAGAPRLVHWVARVPDLAAAEPAAAGLDDIRDLSRGPYRWRFAGTRSGRLPADGIHPALIEWRSALPPAALPDAGCRLSRLVLRHHDPECRAALPAGDPRVCVARGLPGLSACIATSWGDVWL
jgi:hypothetical protein